MAMLNNQMGKICKHIWSTRLHMKTCRKSKKLSVQQRWMIPRRRRSYTDHHWLSWRNKMQQWNIHCCCNIVVNRPAKICVCIYTCTMYIYILQYIYYTYIYTYIYILAVPVAHYYCDCLAYFVPEKLFYICGFRSDQFLCLSWEEHEKHLMVWDGALP